MSDRIAVFNEGHIEQIGTPHDLYEAPQTKFVADFIGETNFVSGRIEAADGNSGKVRNLSGQMSAPLSEGTNAVLAVRPERLHVVGGAGAADDDNTLSGTVKELIYLGPSRKAIIALEDGTEVIALEQAAQAEATALEIGARATLSFRSKDARILADV